jgi:hypothetical protein
MNNMRKVLCFSVAMMLAAFALPSIGAPQFTKQYSLTMTSSVSAPLTVTAHLTNVSPVGNSNIGSFQLTVTGAKITSVVQPATGTATVDPTQTSVFVTGIFPLKPSAPEFQLTIHLGDCGDGITWSATVWTGSMGQTFTPSPNPLPAGQLTTPVSCGNLACNDSFTVPVSTVACSTSPTDTKCVTGQRGFYDKDGATSVNFCDVVPYSATNTVATDGKLHFAWPLDTTTGDPAAAFQYTVNGTGLLPPPGSTKVAWLNTNGTPTSQPGTADLIPALDCLAPKNLPAPYGTLTANVLATDLTITVNTTIPSGAHPAIPHAPPPFDIVIGTDPNTERMTVTAVSGLPAAESWTVTRGVANVGPAVFHAQNLLAMSTPLPIMLITQGTGGQYAAGNQAQMCIAARGEYGDGGPPHFTTFIDIGDGWTTDP